MTHPDLHTTIYVMHTCSTPCTLYIPGNKLGEGM